MKKILLFFIICLLIISSKQVSAVTPVDEQHIQMALSNLTARRYVPFEEAVYFFERMGKDAVPILVRELRSKGEEDKFYTNLIYTIGRLGENGRIAGSSVRSFLDNESRDIVATSIIALGKIRDENSVDRLSSFLHHDDNWIRSKAVEALNNIGTEEAMVALGQVDTESKESGNK